MKRLTAVALLLASLNVSAATQAPADTFGTQLDCATKKALNAYSPNISESSRVRRAVDACIAASMPDSPRTIQASARMTLVAVEERREDLVDATMRRLQLCRDAGIATKKFFVACPQLFTLEPVTSY